MIEIRDWDNTMTLAVLTDPLVKDQLAGVDLTNARLHGHGLDWTGADLLGCNLTGARLRGCDLRTAKLPHLSAMDGADYEINRTPRYWRMQNFYNIAFSEKQVCV